jgi:hypothetical protein
LSADSADYRRPFSSAAVCEICGEFAFKDHCRIFFQVVVFHTTDHLREVGGAGNCHEGRGVRRDGRAPRSDSQYQAGSIRSEKALTTDDTDNTDYRRSAQYHDGRPRRHLMIGFGYFSCYPWLKPFPASRVNDSTQAGRRAADIPGSDSSSRLCGDKGNQRVPSPP